MPPRTLLRIALSLLLSLPGLAPAGDYRVGVEDVDYSPIMSVNPLDGRFSGFSRELLDLFAARTGHRFSYVPLPVKRLLSQHLQGELDLVFPDHPRWQAELKAGTRIAYSTPAIPFQNVVLMRPGQVGKPLKSLGLVRGFSARQPFKAQIEAGTLPVTEVAGPAQLLRMVMAGRLDGAEMALQVGQFHLQQMGLTGALQADPAYSAKYEHHYRLSSIRHPALIEQFDQFLRSDAPAIGVMLKRYGL